MKSAGRLNTISYKSFVKQRFVMHKSYFLMMLVYALFYIASVLYFSINGRVRDALLAFAFLLIAPLILLIERNTHITMPPLFAAGAFFLLLGCTLGSGYDVYTYFPAWDDILHGFSGFFFGCLGFTIFEALLGQPKKGKSFAAALLFGLGFCFMMGFMWEIFEWIATNLVGADMEEDALIHGFHSYFLSGTHAEAVNVDGIVQTVIYLADGSTIVLDGYLDLGLIDTLNDMVLCLIGAIAYVVVIPLIYTKASGIYDAIMPKVSRMATIRHDEYKRAPHVVRQ